MSDQASGDIVGHGVADLTATLAKNRGWFIGLGWVLIVLGIVAILFPWVTTIAAKTALGWLILIGGIAHVVHAFQAKAWKGFLYDLLIGLLYVVVGGWLALFPLAGIITLTILIAVTFMIEGVLKIGMGIRMRPHSGWFWLGGSGVIAILAGILLLTGLPSTATWAIGFLVGINLLSSGWSFLNLAFAVGKD